MNAETEIIAVTEGIYLECPEDPKRFLLKPIGMYHCPWCGCMQMGGRRHSRHEAECWMGLWDPK